MSSVHDRRLLIRVSRLYYEQGMTQSQIGERLRISRQKVQRLLRRARDENIVRICIQPIMGAYSDLEEGLVGTFGLREALVVETSAYKDQTTIAREVGAGGAEYLLHVVKLQDKIVISNWSRALRGMVHALQFARATADIDVLVIQGLSELGYPGAVFDPADLTRNLAEALGGRALFIPAPGIATDRVSRDAFCTDPMVARVLDQARAANLAFMGIGAIGREPTAMWEGDIVSTVELSGLAKRGVVGEINLHYFTERGEPAPSSLDDRVVGLTLEEIRQIDCTVCLAGGAEKFHAIRGALHGQMADVLITDHVTAQRLLEQQG